jgi:hypothetical protein
MFMKVFAQILFLIVFCNLLISAQQKISPRFEDYKVSKFARKYYVVAHSCGTGCRYYTMTDLSSGRELDLLNAFASTEPLPKTSDGREYLTILYYRYNSKLLIAQYLVDFDSEKEKCRERSFLFEGGKLKPITKIKYKCSKF